MDLRHGSAKCADNPTSPSKPQHGLVYGDHADPSHSDRRHPSSAWLSGSLYGRHMQHNASGLDQFARRSRCSSACVNSPSHPRTVFAWIERQTAHFRYRRRGEGRVDDWVFVPDVESKTAWSENISCKSSIGWNLALCCEPSWLSGVEPDFQSPGTFGNKRGIKRCENISRKACPYRRTAWQGNHPADISVCHPRILRAADRFREIFGPSVPCGPYRSRELTRPAVSKSFPSPVYQFVWWQTFSRSRPREKLGLKMRALPVWSWVHFHSFWLRSKDWVRVWIWSGRGGWIRTRKPELIQFFFLSDPWSPSCCWSWNAVFRHALCWYPGYRSCCHHLSGTGSIITFLQLENGVTASRREQRPPLSSRQMSGRTKERWERREKRTKQTNE